jgi:glycosyltransferase involved in cell wall biosynthesis
MTLRRRILYVAREWPCPPRQGSHLRILNIGRQLRGLGDLTFLYVGPDENSPSRSATEEEFGSVIAIPTILRKWPLCLDTFRHKIEFHCPWHYGDYVSHSDRRRFVRLLHQFDLVWFHTLGSADAFRQNHYPHSVIDLDDLNQIKFAEMGRYLNTARSRIAGTLLSFKWQRRENRAIDRFSRVAVCSEEDRILLGSSDRIAVIPNGFENPSFPPHWKDRNQNRLGFIGLLGYAPNLHGLRWFARQVWPLVRQQVPSAVLRIVGRIDPGADFWGISGFEHTGFLPDTTEEFASWSALIVPIQFGGGTRIKILEAFSRMCPVITTPVGAHGLEVKDGQHLLIRQSPKEVANACIELLQKPPLGQHLSEAGRSLFESKYEWNRIGPVIRDISEKAALA